MQCCSLTCRAPGPTNVPWPAADAQTVLSDPCLGLSSTYPWPFMFATIATLLIFFVEFALKKYYNWRTSRIAAAAAGQDAGNPKTAEAADVEAVRNPCCQKPNHNPVLC